MERPTRRQVVDVVTTPSLWPVAYHRLVHGKGYYEARHSPPGYPEWPWSAQRRGAKDPAVCNICRWHGPAFEGPRHVEFQACPRCGSIVRDRALFHAFTSRTAPAGGLRVLETSPRLGPEYKAAMASWFHYLPSDFDLRAHKGSVQIDLQDIRLPDASIDVILTPHVLEHVPDTDRALREIHRVLAPGGHLYLQIPLLQGATAPPATPEFHGDDTPVFWRFGFDLIDRLRDHGFTTTLLCAQDWYDAVARGATEWNEGTDPTWDVPSMLAAAKGRLDDHTVQLPTAEAQRMGLWHGYMCLTFACDKPA